MYLFDRVEEKNINNCFEIYAINEKDNQAYLLKDVIIETSESSTEGFSLKIGRRGDTYVYRGRFENKKDMDSFLKNIIDLLDAADRKNAVK